MAAADFDALKTELDRLIRAGQGALAAERLSQIKAREIPRVWLADFAALARRAQRPELAITWLRPVVRPQTLTEKETPATAKELAIYASVLSRVGANLEALEILKGISRDSLPEIRLFTAFAHMHEWDYASAIPQLESYVRIESLTEYEKTLGQLNLAAAYRFTTRKSKAETELLRDIIDKARMHGWTLHLRNALELAGQSAIARQDWLEAEERLSQAEALCREVGLDDFFIRKWTVLLNLHRLGRESGAVAHWAELERIRKEAETRRDWETLRECDYYRALFTRDVDLALRVYFGTPIPSYRKRMEKSAEEWLRVPDSYAWSPSGGVAGREFDLHSGVDSDDSVRMKTGQIMHRYLSFLASDFYRPFQKGYLFAHLYPGEYYDPETSTARLKMVTVKLRKWFEANRIPLRVESEEGAYRLTAEEAYALRVRKDPLGAEADVEEEQEAWLKRLREKWPYKSFSTRQVTEELGLTPAQVREFLRWAEAERRLRRIGRSRSTLFSFAK